MSFVPDYLGARNGLRSANALSHESLRSTPSHSASAPEISPVPPTRRLQMSNRKIALWLGAMSPTDPKRPPDKAVMVVTISDGPPYLVWPIDLDALPETLT
jgi:hypothetical protein